MNKVLALSALMLMAFAPGAMAGGEQTQETLRVGESYQLKAFAVEMAPDRSRMVMMVHEAYPGTHALRGKRVAVEVGSAEVLVYNPGGSSEFRQGSPEDFRLGEKTYVQAELVSVDGHLPRFEAREMKLFPGFRLDGQKPDHGKDPSKDPNKDPNKDRCPPDQDDITDADNGSPALVRPGTRECEGEREQPRFHGGFLNRVWKVDATVNSFEDGQLSVLVERFRGLPRRFNSQDDRLVDEEAIVLVSSKVRVYQDGKRLKRSLVAEALEEAEDVRLQVKLLPPNRWAEDEDGLRVPTFRAKRISILS